MLARWGTRFWAWLVDFIIVTTAAEILFAIAYSPLAFLQGAGEEGVNPALGAARYAVQSLMFFAYWTYFESAAAGATGQSIGKKLLKIKTTDLSGSKAPDVKSAAIQSFGKAFLLPIDVLLGWIFTNDKRQRLLSRAANTIVVKVPAEDAGTGNVRYRKDK
ncbi:MAG: RDD family protein [Thermoproteota archaeon]